MKTNIILNQEKAISRVGEIYDRLKSDPIFKEAVNNSIVPTLSQGKSRKTETEKDYKIIYKILNQEYGSEVLSETTIWRLLKIKNASQEAFNSLMSGKPNIKKTYDNTFKKPASTKEIKDAVIEEYKKLEDLNLEAFSKSLDAMTEQTLEWESKLSNEPNIKDLKEIDAKIFKLRKTLGKIIVKYDVEENYI